MYIIKKKIIFFAFAIFLLALATIVNSISQTIYLWKLTKNNNNLLIEQENKINQTDINLGSNIGYGTLSENLPVVLFFEKVSHFCVSNNLRLINLYPQESFEIENNTIIHRQIYVEGSYKSILNLIYYLEKESKSAHVSSCAFELKKDIKSKKEQLFASIQIDNLSKDE
jgi:hypothetical protein